MQKEYTPLPVFTGVGSPYGCPWELRILFFWFSVKILIDHGLGMFDPAIPPQILFIPWQDLDPSAPKKVSLALLGPANF